MLWPLKHFDYPYQVDSVICEIAKPILKIIIREKMLLIVSLLLYF